MFLAFIAPFVVSRFRLLCVTVTPVVCFVAMLQRLNLVEVPSDGPSDAETNYFDWEPSQEESQLPVWMPPDDVQKQFAGVSQSHKMTVTDVQNIEVSAESPNKRRKLIKRGSEAECNVTTWSDTTTVRFPILPLSLKPESC